MKHLQNFKIFENNEHLLSFIHDRIIDLEDRGYKIHTYVHSPNDHIIITIKTDRFMIQSEQQVISKMNSQLAEIIPTLNKLSTDKAIELFKKVSLHAELWVEDKSGDGGSGDSIPYKIVNNKWVPYKNRLEEYAYKMIHGKQGDISYVGDYSFAELKLIFEPYKRKKRV